MAEEWYRCTRRWIDRSLSRLSAGAAVWNVTAEEQAAGYPCDAYLDRPWRGLLRGIDIAAPAPVAYRWLCQLKVAPYSYDLLDNAGRRSPRYLIPGVHELAVGQRFLVFTITDFESDTHISGTGRAAFARLYGPLAITYCVKAVEVGACRVVVKLNVGTDGRWQRARAAALAVGDLIMMRKQLRTMKALAEATSLSTCDE